MSDDRRPCGHCGWIVGGDPASEKDSSRFHDACIRELPGVIFACCGHGDLTWMDEGYWHTSCYLVFDDGITLYGRAAHAAMEMLGGHPPPLPETGLVGWRRHEGIEHIVVVGTRAVRSRRDTASSWVSLN